MNKTNKQLPTNVLRTKANIWKTAIDSQEFARRMDEEDSFASFRQQFAFPKKRDLPFGEFLLIICLKSYRILF